MTPDAAERRALQRLREDTARRMDAMPTTHDDDVRTLIAAHDALVDALRATVVRAVAAEGAIALLSRTLGCESGDPAGIVREALDYAAEQRERADERDDALAQRDAADARHAALAGAVRAEREARAHMRRIERNPDETVAEIDEAGRSVRGAMDRTDALLRGAPGGYVPVGAVREYLAAEALLFASYYRAGFSAFDDSPDAASAREEETTAKATLTAARTALDAALAAAGCS